MVSIVIFYNNTRNLTAKISLTLKITHHEKVALPFFLSFFLSNLSFAQTPPPEWGECTEFDDPIEADRVVEFSQFMGINLRRADPIGFATCVGSVREYHNWDVDEASNCFQITYKFRVTSEDSGIDNLTWEILDASDPNQTVLVDSRGLYPYDGAENDDERTIRIKDFFCIRHPGTNYILRLFIPEGGDLGKFEFEIDRPGEFAPFLTITQNEFSGSAYTEEFTVSEQELHAFYPNNRYEWDPANSGQSGITSYDNFYQELNDLNLEVCATIMLGSQGVSNGVPNAIGAPSFIVQGDDYCENLIVEEDDPSNPLGYRWYGDYLTQFANRYGAAGSLTAAADKHNEDPANATTRGLVQFVENWNEQDHFWDDAGTIEPEEYAMMVSIAYDGFGGETTQGMVGQFNCEPNSPEYPLGVREMMPFVMGGTSNIDRNYLECMIEWFVDNRAGVVEPVIPFDVLNFHNYSNVDGAFNLGAGISPEESGLFDNLREMDLIRNELENKYGENFDLWLSEFGYNTAPGENFSSNVFLVPPISNPSTGLTSDRYEVHGQWIARSFLTIAAANFDKAFVYEIRDQASQGNTLAAWDLKCGLLESANDGYQPKKAWYYTSSLKSILAGMDFTEIVEGGSLECEANSPMIYKFDPIEMGDDREIYAIWSPTSCNVEAFEFTLEDIGAFNEATLIELEVPSTTGIRSELTVANNSVDVMVSERPIFVVINEAPEEITCPNDLDAFNITCSSVSIAWGIPDGQAYDYYQLWYGPLGGIDDAENPDIFNDDITLFDSDVSGDVRQAVIGGLLPETEYLFYVIGIGENNSTGWCPPLQATTTEEGCNIQLDMSMISAVDSDGNMINPPDLDHLIDDQNDPDNNIDCCSLPESDSYSEWSTYGDDVVVIIDLGVPHDIDFIYLFDGSGLSHVFFDYLDGDEWLPMADYETIRYLKWHTIANEAPPCQPIQFLRIRSAMNNGKIDELVLCGKPANLDNLPNADFTVNVDCGTAMFTSAEGTDGPNFSHLWSFDDNANSTSTDVNPTFQYLVNGTYTVTHTLTNECGTDVATNMVDIEVCSTNECICENGYNIGEPGGTITLNNSGIPLEGGKLEATCVSVEGTLLINQNFTFETVNFRMGPNAEILIDGGGNNNFRVEIFGSNLRGCSEMWSGINIVNKGELDFIGNTISDAVSAIFPTNDTKLRVVDNDFIGNRVGIFTEAISGGADFQFIKRIDEDVIYDNRFSCPENLLPPLDTERSFAAIQLSHTNQFTIGDDDELPNTITESSHGIFMNQTSNCKITNNRIEDLFMTQNSGRNAGIKMFSSSGTLIKNNFIKNAPRGVDSDRSEFNIFGNEIDLTDLGPLAGGIFGVGISSRFGFRQEIQLNTIVAHHPISIFRPLNDESEEWDISVHDNPEIRSFGNNLAFGVVTIEQGGGNIRVENNHIFYGFARVPGIRLHGYEGESLIYNNDINRSAENVYFPGGENDGVGIKLFNTGNVQVIDNRINTMAYPGEPIPIGRSIDIVNCSNLFFCCNTVNNSKWGISFNGANSGIDLNTTQFGNHQDAGLFLANATIDPQLASGNDWGNSQGSFYARYLGDFEFFQLNEYRSEQFLWPDGLSKIIVPSDPLFQSGDWFQSPTTSDITDCDINTSPNNQIACGVPFNEPLSPPENPGEIGQVDINVASVDIYTPNSVKNGVYYEYKRQLYKNLKEDQALIGQNNEIANFYYNHHQTQTSSPIDRFYLHDDNLNKLSDLTYFFGSSFAATHADIDNLNQEIKGLRQALKYASSQNRPAISEDLLLAIGKQNHAVRKLNDKIEYAENQQSSAYQSLLSQNSSTVASEIFEQNQKNFNQVYLELLIADNMDLNAEQKTIINDLAFQCYYAGGRAVMQARAIQRINGSYYDYDKYDKDCKSDNKAELKSKSTTEIANNITIAPNPTAARFTVDLGQYLEESGSYRLVNPYGKVIQNGNLEDGTRRFALDLTGNHPGIYYLEIKGLDYRYYLKKIILTPDY